MGCKEMAMYDGGKFVRMSMETTALHHNLSNFKVPSNVAI